MGAIAPVSGPQDPSQLNNLLNQIIGQINTANASSRHERFTAPIASELVSVVNAVTPSNVALTLAAQPDYPRKLNIRVVVGTTTTTAITAGSLVLVGINQLGQVVTETISLIANASKTVISTNCYAHVTSATVSAYAASGSGTGNTVGVGVSTALGLTLPVGFNNLVVFKADVDAGDETVGTVDTTAGTIIPNTAANATHSYDFWYSYNFAE